MKMGIMAGMGTRTRMIYTSSFSYPIEKVESRVFFIFIHIPSPCKNLL